MPKINIYEQNKYEGKFMLSWGSFEDEKYLSQTDGLNDEQKDRMRAADRLESSLPLPKISLSGV